MKKKLQIVDFEQAKRLKDLGFDWEFNSIGIPNRKCYLPNGEVLCSANILISQPELGNGYTEEDCISAPTVALALKWMRDVKNLFPVVRQQFTGGVTGKPEISADCSYIPELNYHNGLLHCTIYSFKTYEQAETSILDKCLDLLENKTE